MNIVLNPYIYEPMLREAHKRWFFHGRCYYTDDFTPLSNEDMDINRDLIIDGVVKDPKYKSMTKQDKINKLYIAEEIFIRTFA